MPPPEYKNHVVALPGEHPDLTGASSTETSKTEARVINFPKTRRSKKKQNGRKRQLAVSDKRDIVANRLYEMLISILDEEAIDAHLIDRIYKAFFERQKLN